MINSDEKIKDFFQQKVYDLDEDEINVFFERYSVDKVIQCLLDELKTLTCSKYGDDSAWQLGRIFGSISKKYCADVQVSLLIKNATEKEKIILFNFLSGYWDQADINCDVLSKLSKNLADTIISSKKLDCSHKLISASIDAITIGYSNNKHLFIANQDVAKELKQNFKCFLAYLVSNNIECPSLQLLTKIAE